MRTVVPHLQKVEDAVPFCFFELDLGLEPGAFQLFVAIIARRQGRRAELPGDRTDRDQGFGLRERPVFCPELQGEFLIVQVEFDLLQLGFDLQQVLQVVLAFFEQSADQRPLIAVHGL